MPKKLFTTVPGAFGACSVAVVKRRATGRHEAGFELVLWFNAGFTWSYQCGSTDDAATVQAVRDCLATDSADPLVLHLLAAWPQFADEYAKASRYAASNPGHVAPGFAAVFRRWWPEAVADEVAA